MAGRCHACGHPQRAEIDGRLARGEVASKVAAEYGLTQRIISNHVRKHLGPVTAAYLEKHACGVVEQVRKLVARAEGALDRVESEGGDLAGRQMGSMYREVRQALELLGKLTGELQTGSVRRLLEKSGARDEAELLAWCDERKALGEMQIEDYFRDGAAMVRFCLEQRPEWADEARRMCFPLLLPESVAEVVEEVEDAAVQG